MSRRYKLPLGCVKITAGEWQARGGLKNPALFRRQVNGRWLYYIDHNH